MIKGVSITELISMKFDKDYDIDAALTRAGIKRAELARRLGITKGSVTYWNSSGVPRYVIAYLDLLSQFDAYKRKMIEAASGS